MNKYRSHNCNELRKKDVGSNILLSGWINKKRDHGNLLFLDLRDNYGITQCIIDKLKIVYEDHWKTFNRINTSIKLPIFVKLDSDDNLKVSNFEKILNEINLVYDYFVLKFDKNHIYYQIIFNGAPNIFLKLMKDKNFVFSTQNKTWILQ